MSKAYDRVEWNYFKGILEKLGFDSKWVGLVMKCLRSASYSFLVNEELRGRVMSLRGLRQGCLLSPYLFLLCAEGLSTMIKIAESDGRLQGLRVARDAPPISHLLFTDDSLMFVHANVDDCNCLKSILEVYEQALGQSINFQKSALSFSPNAADGATSSIKDLFHVDVVSCHNSYLGLPSSISINKRKIFGGLKERVC
ncbi:hypothetical protein ACOSQ2_019225 [Xanthoceras sorbifolium]